MCCFWRQRLPVFGFSGCGTCGAASSAAPVYVQSVADIAGLNTGAIPRYSGVVEPQQTYEIQKDDTKTVAEIYVSEGDQVTPGDALFRYDTQEIQMNLDQAKLIWKTSPTGLPP